MSEYIEFAPGERPEVEVLVEGTWYPGELNAWSQPGVANGYSTGWWGNVTYRTDAGERHRKTVPYHRIRAADPPVDR